MQIPFLSGKPAGRLASLLMLCSVLVPMAAAWGDEDPESLDIMERQMAHLQQQQQALQNELAAMHQQIAQHRARLGGTSAASGAGGAGHPLEVTGSGGHVRGGWVPVEGHAPQQAAVTGGERVGRPHIGGYSDPTSELGDQPTVESVVAHREEDLISHMANNNVGPHNRETVGAQSAGALGSKVFHLGPVAIILGGFFDAAALVENRQVSSGIFNYWNAIPFRNSSNFHTTNFNGDARYSRFSLMARGQLNPHLTVAGFVETDFGASAETTNPYESNSYVPRLRQAYLTLDDSRADLHFLIGQAWTMLTPDRVGIVPRQESLPETIESSILAGQTWSRQWQVRIVKDFLKHRLWTGLSIENPATIYDTSGFGDDVGNGEFRLPGNSSNYAKLGSNGVGLSSATTNYSNEIAPDIIGKLAWDPSWGHYEVEGVVHFPHDRSVMNGVGENHTAIAWGAGGSMILPVIPHRLEVRLAGLAGKGIGRYGSVLLPDATLRANGGPALLSSAQTTAGVIAHPNKVIDVYGYFGMQRSGRNYFDEDGGSYGYGNPNADNTGCMTEGSGINGGGGCAANIRSVEEFTIGAWYRFIHGQYGTVQAGTQLAYSRVHTWGGMGGAPTTSLSEIFFDFRYLPFQ